MKTAETAPVNFSIDQLLAAGGPTCLIIKATFEPLGGQDRFQPAGFPEMGHVIYEAPRRSKPDKNVCIVDSAASMANHLESLCFENPSAGILHPDLEGLPYVRCVTDPNNRLVVTSLSEGHRLASDYFLDSELKGEEFHSILRKEFGIVEVKKDKTYFTAPGDWWNIYKTIFRYDPNSLVHGILFAREQLRISRLLTASLEAFGAARVGTSGVKFDRLGKTNSGQPIFSKDDETAERIEATFLIDLGLLRSYGHKTDGLNGAEKRLLLELALWKINRMLAAPFRFRSGCHLQCTDSSYKTEDETSVEIKDLDISAAVKNCSFGPDPVTDVYYAAEKLFKAEADKPDETKITEEKAEDPSDS